MDLFMLLEHIEMLKEVWKEDKRVEKPVLDKQKMQDHAFGLEMAIKDNLTVYNGLNYSYVPIKGMNGSAQTISCIDQEKKEDITIRFHDIFEVTIL